MDTTPKHKPFGFHGIPLDGDDVQKHGDCPFCGKEQHFHVSPSTGKWDCKSCLDEGNVYGFLRLLHKESLAVTKKKQLKSLSQKKNLPVSILKTYKVVKSIITDDWLIPLYNKRGKLCNLYKWDEDTNRILSSPFPCIHHPFNIQTLSANTDTPLWICEGHWDTMALDYILRECKMRKKIDVIGAPGAGTFNKDWLEYLFDRNVNLAYDHDYPKKRKRKVLQPGRDGMNRILKMATQSTLQPKSIRMINWTGADKVESLPDKFDIRDLLMKED